MESFIERKIKQWIAEEKYSRTGLKFAFGDYKLFFSIDCSEMDQFDKNRNRYTTQQLIPRVERKLINVFKHRSDFQHLNMLTDQVLYSDHIRKAEFIYNKVKTIEYCSITVEVKHRNAYIYIHSPNNFILISQDHNGTVVNTYRHNCQEDVSQFIEKVVKGSKLETQLIVIDSNSLEELLRRNVERNYMSFMESQTIKKHLNLSDEDVILKCECNNEKDSFLEYIVASIKSN